MVINGLIGVIWKMFRHPLLKSVFSSCVGRSDGEEARREVLPCLSDPRTVAAWLPELFREAFRRIAMGNVLTAPDGS
jgi:hypothetical protein